MKNQDKIKNAQENLELAKRELAVALGTEHPKLDDFRSGSKTKMISIFALIGLCITCIYCYLNDAILAMYPDAGVHALVTIHKVFAVILFLSFIEIWLAITEKLKDNYLSRYGDSKQFLMIDKIQDFYNAKPEHRLWIRFAYFALRFFCAITLASGNLI